MLHHHPACQQAEQSGADIAGRQPDLQSAELWRSWGCRGVDLEREIADAEKGGNAIHDQTVADREIRGPRRARLGLGKRVREAAIRVGIKTEKLRRPQDITGKDRPRRQGKGLERQRDPVAASAVDDRRHGNIPQPQIVVDIAAKIYAEKASILGQPPACRQFQEGRHAFGSRQSNFQGLEGWPACGGKTRCREIEVGDLKEATYCLSSAAASDIIQC